MEPAFESTPEKEPYGLGVAPPSLEEGPTFLTVIFREATRKKCLPPCDIVDLLIFACLDFHEFAIWGLFVKSIIRELSILMMGNAIIMIIFARFSNSRICPPLEIRKN